jgi:hypothetical protein
MKEYSGTSQKREVTQCFFNSFDANESASANSEQTLSTDSCRERIISPAARARATSYTHAAINISFINSVSLTAHSSENVFL